MSALQTGIMSTWQEREKKYLLEHLAKVKVQAVSNEPKDILAGLSPKVHALMDCLLEEERQSRTQEEAYSGLIFVTRRDAVIALGEILSRAPAMKQHFQIGCLLGNSGSFKRHAFLDITRTLLKQTPTETLNDFKIGDKNIIVSTAVAEEGIDIQACGCVIRFDPPPNMVAWAQSRGRARRRRSTFVLLMGEVDASAEKMTQWHRIEQEMVKKYTDFDREDQQMDIADLDDPISFCVEKTGYVTRLDV